MQPFRIHVRDETLNDLRERLARTVWPDEIQDTAGRFGLSVSYMKQLVDHWQNKYNWREHESALNAFPQFIAEVEGHRIHFIHQRGKGTNPIPIIMTHGWPGSFAEFTKVIPRLTDPANGDSFDVVVPSIPGYGFSDRPRQSGMNALRVSELWVQLMEQLGYRRFAAQGGDWGATISTWLGLNHPDRLIGIHLNYIPGSYKPWIDNSSTALTASEHLFLESLNEWDLNEGAYGHVQRTKPLSLAYGLTDSPAALAAWIIEKFRDWSDCNGDVEKRFSKDELLTNVMIYWVTGTIHSSMRLYEEARHRPVHFRSGDRVAVPCAVARFEKEAPFPPREWIERGYNVMQWSEFPVGGHFAAMEEPELFADDIRTFFGKLRRA